MEAIFIFENEICIDANDISYKMYGYNSKDEIIGKHLKEFIPKETYEGLIKNIKKKPKLLFMKGKGIKKDGTMIDVISKGTNAISNK